MSDDFTLYLALGLLAVLTLLAFASPRHRRRPSQAASGEGDSIVRPITGVDHSPLSGSGGDFGGGGADGGWGGDGGGGDGGGGGGD